MASLRISIALIVSVFFASNVVAQGDFFFSFTEGGANSDQSMDFEIGDTGSLWIYWSTNGPADSDLNVGGFIDVFSSTSGVIEFTAAETFDYDITIFGMDIGNRILDANGAGGVVGLVESVEADFIDELAAFTGIGGPGIIETNNGQNSFLDEGYDAGNDGFQWGRIDFNVVGAGTTEVTGVVGDGQIVNDTSTIDAAFTTATINVVGIPEPSTSCVLCLGVAAIGFRLRR